jgi:thiopurine S-methyltransferase
MVDKNEFWHQRWKENRIGFHKSDVNPLMLKFLSPLLREPSRILAPLCGKSVDLAWFASQGHEVVGVDVSEIAVQAFSAEQGVSFEVESSPPFKAYRGKSLTYFVGDVFDLQPERVGKFDWIYDRAALIALPPDTRKIYAERLKSFLKPGGRVFLITIEYDQTRMDGPPFSVPESEVRSLFADVRVEKLHSHDCLDEEAQFKARGLDWMKEIVYCIG